MKLRGNAAVHIEPLGDCAALVHLGDGIDVQLSARSVAVAATIQAAALPGLLDVAPAYASVCVRYDPCAWIGDDASTPFARFSARLQQCVESAHDTEYAESAPVCEIPLCYGGEFGPDLDAVAQHSGLAPDEVIARHSASEYRVAMLGFAPGFPYLLGLDAALHMPRRASPRTHVAAGSVAIGGAQTGIYPRTLPGGWQVIGRTPLQLFDAARNPPALLAPGQRVRFRVIAAAAMAAAAAGT